MDTLAKITHFFSVYGYYFLFFATWLENIPIIGLFLPGELIVVLGAFLAASPGGLSLLGVIIVAFLGGFFGSLSSYYLGAWQGRPFIERWAEKFNVDGERLRQADSFFHQRGYLTVFIGRYLTGVKAFIPVLAGIHRLNLLTFTVFSALGVLSWTVLASLLGYFFGANWPLLLKYLRLLSWFILLLVATVIIILWLKKRWQTKQKF